MRFVPHLVLKRKALQLSEWDILDFKPRARGLVIGNLNWLARISDKVRASKSGRIGDYVFP